MADEKKSEWDGYDTGILFYAADAVERLDTAAAYRLRQQGLTLRGHSGSYRVVIETFYSDLSRREKNDLLVSAVLRGYSINEDDKLFAARYFGRTASHREPPFAAMSRKGVRSGVFELSDVCSSASMHVPNGSD